MILLNLQLVSFYEIYTFFEHKTYLFYPLSVNAFSGRLSGVDDGHASAPTSSSASSR